MKRGTLKGNEATPYHRITHFLPERDAEQILTDILGQQSKFCPLTGNRNFLRLPIPIEPPPTFCQKLWAILPDIQALFGIDLQRPEIELYVHAYNDGTHFERHSDAYGGGNWRRRISCVYYLHRLPRAFEGGDLVIYDGHRRAYAVEPEHNSALFFPSHLIHEVLSVTCRSKEFIDSRFAINVWIM
ncbi:MAG: 2OG-Fe(II) oxygenase [Chthoniobacterales bacterium]